MMKVIALLALLVAFMGLTGERFFTPVTKHDTGMAVAMASEMAGDLVYGTQVCGTSGACSAGEVTVNPPGFSINQALFSQVTDGDGNIAAWWNNPGGRYADITDARLVAALGSQAAFDELEPLGQTFVFGYWDGKGQITVEGGGGRAFEPPATLVAVIGAAPHPPAAGSAMIVYSGPAVS